MYFLLFVMAFLLFNPAASLDAQTPSAETTAYEFSAAWVGVTPRGTVTTNSNTVDFLADLGMASLQSQARFHFTIRPSERKRIFIEFLPYRFSGENIVERDFRFGGVTYKASERITSKASLKYVAAGFQYDFVHRQRVDAGIIGAVAYLGLSADAVSTSAGNSEVDRNIGFPLAGGAVRFSPVSRLPWLTIRAEGKGMSFGSYGHYVEGAAGIGFRMASHFTLESGYRMVDGDGHQGTRGAKFRLNGPFIGIRVHDDK